MEEEEDEDEGENEQREYNLRSLENIQAID